jgi:hypothetical protein
MRRRVLAVLAYVLPTFPLGFFWHLTIFADYYKSLEVYRSDMIIPFGVIAMLTQGVIWALLYERLFAGEPIFRGAAKFAAIACPLGWSFMVLAVSAKHVMTSPADFLLIETAFMVVQYLVVSPLIAAVYARNG